MSQPHGRSCSLRLCTCAVELIENTIDRQTCTYWHSIAHVVRTDRSRELLCRLSVEKLHQTTSYLPPSLSSPAYLSAILVLAGMTHWALHESVTYVPLKV